MGRKIFVSYKYGDTTVQSLSTWGVTRVRDYVDKLQEQLAQDDHINKGELDGEDLSQFRDDTIASKLRNKIYDSSITIVLVSPGMREAYSAESDQWIPWEVAYSLREQTRNDRVSRTNAVLAVVLPDSLGSYSYFIEENSCPYCHCRTLRTDRLFHILKANMFNVRSPSFENCTNHPENSVFLGFSSYIHSVKWSDFTSNIELNLRIAEGIRERIDDYVISKEVTPAPQPGTYPIQWTLH